MSLSVMSYIIIMLIIAIIMILKGSSMAYFA